MQYNSLITILSYHLVIYNFVFSDSSVQDNSHPSMQRKLAMSPLNEILRSSTALHLLIGPSDM